MKPIEERCRQLRFRAFPTPDTLPALYARCLPLLTAGRSFTRIEYYDPEGSGDGVGLMVASGLRLDARNGLPDQLRPGAGSFGFPLSRVYSFAVHSCAPPGTVTDEATAASRFHARERDSAQLLVNGIGEGSEDYLEFTYRNDRGVVSVTRLQLEDRDAVLSPDL
ncbi:Uncharacterised protein (plasmid) [Tsukamurella tyrosinosolvens]|uniref:Uncharacterized protein n=1 Tax=Tsukamurella tyrosinosolvens TaxID=57704 RepID=A0A1H4V4Y8_TSUTY|nr:hypothetical protein [Tsukamurella tyrosinosolvens]KXO91044.1 hypothetical protein AXK58_21680 [Tsukamurella tyrosinosolvens]SEC76159.1 hypothetical protein SAMN04489793_3146 [Tsukamurella tyrosinosolvens]VEH90678.1 Uncharacterised protein [Tsukamurella tyrosinosolvens]